MVRAGTTPHGARDDIALALRRLFAPHLADPVESRLLRRLAHRWTRIVRRLRPLGDVSQGNEVLVLADGDAAFDAQWEAIAEARRRVLLDTYILEDDAVGRRTVQALEEAARRGCEVVLLFDAFGSNELAEEFHAGLRQAGGRVVAFNPFFGSHRRFSRLVRNHQKILVVDGSVAFCGGMNVADDYAGPRHGNGLFRDTHLRVRGPCVDALEELVLQTLEECLGVEAPAPSPPSSPIEGEDGALVQVLESNVARQRRAIQKALRLTLGRAVDHCYLTSPYFVPPRRFLRAIQHAARRGVDVRVLTAGRSDVPLVRLASRHLYRRLLKAGVRIYEMQGRLLHAKVVCIDGVYGSVGSFNLDYWSYRRNLEVTVSILDRRIPLELEEQFARDLEISREIDAQTWSERNLVKRLASWTAYQVMRL